MKKVNCEVFVADEPLVKVARRDITFLAERVGATERKRIRLCAHPDASDRLHEMFIVLSRDTYIRPHKHFNKAESLHVIQGAADVVFFDDDGAINEVVPLGEYATGRCFYYRVGRPDYHTLVLHTDVFIFQETTQGPFVRSDTAFAPWSPDDSDPAAARAYMDRLARAVAARTA